VSGPRTSAEVLAGGGTRWQLRTHQWRPVLRGIRVWHEEALDRLLLVRATALALPAGGAIGGRTAAWLHGVDVVESDGAVEVVLPRDTPFAPRDGLRVRRALLPPSDLELVAGVPVVNESLYDDDGRFLARPDLRLGHVLIEFDGSVHRDGDQFVRDLRRQNRLVDAGYTVLRYTAADVYRKPGMITSQIRHALQAPPPRRS
jgi:hypothetical protein